MQHRRRRLSMVGCLPAWPVRPTHHLATGLGITVGGLLALPARTADAQTTRIIADSSSYLLRVTQHWSRESALGALTERRMAAEDIEVRLWQGYGLGGTWGFVLRREQGRWSAVRVDIVTCTYRVPIPVGDTLTPPSLARYQRLAIARCDEHDPGEGEPPPGTYGWSVISADTVGIVPLRFTSAASELWSDLVRAGITELPTRVPRSWIMVDGCTYVVELRRAHEYRASVIEYTSPPATGADSLVQSVAAIFDRLSQRRWAREDLIGPNKPLLKTLPTR